MEHLVYPAEEPEKSEVAYAYWETALSGNWAEKSDLPDFVLPKTKWLGFNHDAISLCEFSTYLDSAGFDSSHLWNAKLRESHADFFGVSADTIGLRVAAAVQAWLYHGLLQSVLGKKVMVSYLVREDSNGMQWLYSRNLPFCLQAKVFKIRQNPDHGEQTSKDIQVAIRVVERWVSRFTSWSHPSFRPKIEQEYPGFMHHLESTIPAIIRLAEVLEQTRLFALPRCQTLGQVTWNLPFRMTEQRRDNLIDLGWCGFQVRLMEDTLNHSTVDWIISQRLGQHRFGHESCTNSECARNNIDASTYQQAHVCVGKDCKKIYPDVTKVMIALIADKIPVVRPTMMGGHLRLMVDAVEKSNPMDYVAISHVWADGLGGATETGLNECQVRKIWRQCSQASGNADTVALWLDSLCIPRSGKKIYMLALIALRDVYIHASLVLVIDKKIEQCSVSSSAELLYSHIYLSSWMQRMWTYEEAVLGERLVFVLKDGFHTYRLDTLPSMRRTVCVVWQCLATQLFRLRADKNLLSIGHIATAFRYRLTNAKQEEFLSISGMLGLDTEQLVSVKGQERTRLFWLMLKSIPFNVLFLDCPKLSIPGFRWAPATFMSPSTTKIDTESAGSTSECTEYGLTGEYLSVTFDRTLKGSAGKTGSIFYLWVRAHDDSIQQPGDHRAVLRVYCVDSWPPRPQFWEFDRIMFGHEERLIPAAGQWVSATAFRRDLESGDSSLRSQSEVEYTVKVQYIGRVLVERLQRGELSSSQTIMFEGSSSVVIDTAAQWSIEKVCVT